MTNERVNTKKTISNTTIIFFFLRKMNQFLVCQRSFFKEKIEIWIKKKRPATSSSTFPHISVKEATRVLIVCVSLFHNPYQIIWHMQRKKLLLEDFLNNKTNIAKFNTLYVLFLFLVLWNLNFFTYDNLKLLYLSRRNRNVLFDVFVTYLKKVN